MEQIASGHVLVLKINCKNAYYRRQIHEVAQKLGCSHRTGYHKHCHKILTALAIEQIQNYKQLAKEDREDDYYTRQITKVYKNPLSFNVRPSSFVTVDARPVFLHYLTQCISKHVSDLVITYLP